MRLPPSLTDPDRWQWFAAGDEAVAPKAAPPSAGDNSAEQLLFEMGLVFAIPLAIAAALSLIWGA